MTEQTEIPLATDSSLLLRRGNSLTTIGQSERQNPFKNPQRPVSKNAKISKKSLLIRSDLQKKKRTRTNAALIRTVVYMFE